MNVLNRPSAKQHHRNEELSLLARRQFSGKQSNQLTPMKACEYDAGKPGSNKTTTDQLTITSIFQNSLARFKISVQNLKQIEHKGLVLTIRQSVPSQSNPMMLFIVSPTSCLHTK